jgi:formyl-CoA transferase
MRRLEEQDILCGPVRSLAEALDSEQTRVNGMIIELGRDEKGRMVKAIGNPVQLSATPARVRLFPPRLGEHTAEVLHGQAPSASAGGARAQGAAGR